MHATKKILFSLFNITVAVALLVFLFKSSPVKTNAQASHPNTCGTYAAVTGISPSGSIGAGAITVRWNAVKNTSGAVITGNVWYHVEINDTSTAANPDYSVETGIGALSAGPYTVTAGHSYVIAVWGRGGCGYGPVATVNASVPAPVKPLPSYTVSLTCSTTISGGFYNASARISGPLLSGSDYLRLTTTMSDGRAYYGDNPYNATFYQSSSMSAGPVSQTYGSFNVKYTLQLFSNGSPTMLNNSSANVVCGTPAPPPPAIPTAPSSVTNTATSSTAPVTVSWKDNASNETGYYVYDGTTLIGQTGANVSSFTDSSKCPGQNGHKYSVQAFNGGGSSSRVSAASGVACPAAPPPAPPTAPSTVTISASTPTGAVTVKWKDNSTNETGFNIYDGTTLTGSVSANVVTFTDNLNCPAQNGHKYSVEAFNGGGASAKAVSAALVCPAATPVPPTIPSAPSSVTISASSPTGPVTAKWKDNSTNETGFNIYDGTTLTGTVTANIITFTDNLNCPAQNGHKYAVEAYNSSGKSAKSTSAALVCPTAPVTPPTAPSGVTVSASSSTATVVVKWKDNSANETGFNIYDGTTLTGTVGANVSTFTDNANCPGQNGHKYSVEAIVGTTPSTRATSTGLVCPTATITPPTAPSGVTVTAANATAAVVIKWKDNSTNETGFNIYDGTTLTGTVGANVTSFTDNSNCPGQNGHKYSVEALIGSTPSTKATSTGLVCPAATPAPPTAPLAPSNVTISVPTATSPVTINWKDNSINETGFNIYDGTAKKGTVTANKVTFTDTASCPAQNGKKYAVEAYNGSGTSARVTAAAVVCPAPPAPGVPNPPSTVKATPSNSAVTAVTITWTNPTGTITGSYIYEKTNGGSAVLVAQLPAAVASYVDSSPACPAGGTIQYQVQVYNSSGNSSKVSSNTITCPGPAIQPAPDATSGKLTPASGSVGNVTVNSLLPKIITVDGSATLAPVNGQASVAYIETQTTVLQPLPGLTQVEQTPVQNNDNYAIPLVWPGFTPPVTQVRVDYALIGANGAVLYSNSVIYTQIGSGPGYTASTPIEPGLMPPGQSSIKQIGQFKTIPTATNNFNDMKNLELNKDYWVRLTIAGDTAPPTTNAFGPSDIMLVLDITGSMDSKFYSDSSKTSSVTKLQGAKTALSTFVDNADPKDYLGFGTFRICRNLYDKSKAPLIWTYEGMSSFYRKTTGFSALHMPLQSLSSNTASVKSQFKNTINNINYAFCLNASGTDVGAGISLGTSQLTDILDDPKSLRPDGTPYKISSVGTYTKNAARSGVPKFIVIATDGQENSSPRFLEPDMDGSTDTIQSAKKRGVKIYTLAIGHDADAYASDLQFIANSTGGKYYPGRTQQELSSAYLGILQNIQGSGGSGTIVVNEKINNTNFDTVVPSKGFPSSNYDFKLTKYDPKTGGETDVTATSCNKLSCLSGSNTDGMNVTLPYFSDKERYYIYFKAHAKAPGVDVDVDSATSQIVYPSGVKQLANTKVTIAGLDSFFVAEGGDVYSHSSSFTPIKSDLPLNTFFVTEDEPVVFYTGPQTALNNNSANLDLGDGQLSPTNREIKGYTVTNGMSYNSLFEKVKDVVKKISITNSNVFAPTAGEVGYYITDSANGDLTIGGPGWDRGPIKDKNIVVFVPGDLYINDSNNGKPFSIASDGRSVVSFVVRGRIGIDPTVTNLQGIYLADGIIDTACNVGIGADGICSPDLKDAPVGSSLTVEGMMYSINGGFNLHRQGTPGTVPGEKFIFRPDFFMNAIVALGHNESTFRECILINCSR